MFDKDEQLVLMPVASCEEINENWDPDWHCCPLCGAPLSVAGVVIHKSKELLFN